MVVDYMSVLVMSKCLSGVPEQWSRAEFCYVHECFSRVSGGGVIFTVNV